MADTVSLILSMSDQNEANPNMIVLLSFLLQILCFILDFFLADTRHKADRVDCCLLSVQCVPSTMPYPTTSLSGPLLLTGACMVSAKQNGTEVSRPYRKHLK